MLLQIHGLNYNRGGWEEALEKAAAWISVMEMLREYSVIGTGCNESAKDGHPCDHLPETCLSEENETRTWIAGVPSGSEGRQEAIGMVSDMARSQWLTMHGSAAAAEMRRRIDVWIHWTCDLYENALTTGLRTEGHQTPPIHRGLILFKTEGGIFRSRHAACVLRTSKPWPSNDWSMSMAGRFSPGLGHHCHYLA